MSSYEKKHPSIGFILICLTYSMTIGFFVWAMSTPDLDRIWTIHHEMKIGKMKKLKRADRRILHKSMRRHKDLARALLKGEQIGIISSNTEGWIATPTATILRTPKSKTNLELTLNIQTPDDLIPYSINLRIIKHDGATHKDELAVTEQGIFSFTLPQPGPSPEIIEVRLGDEKFEADPSMLGVQIGFPESEQNSDQTQANNPKVKGS